MSTPPHMNQQRRTGKRNGGGESGSGAGATSSKVVPARATLETSAGGVVYRLDDGEPLFLVIRDSYHNWGFPKGHLEANEAPDVAAVREVREETGLDTVTLDGAIETIEWYFRFRGKLVHKICHFFLMQTTSAKTKPQREEGITACRWARFDDAMRLVSYDNAREVLTRANVMVENLHLPGDQVGDLRA